MIEKTRGNSSTLRSKSRGKTAVGSNGGTSRSKERIKIRSTDNNVTTTLPNSNTMLEELQKQILIRAA